MIRLSVLALVFACASASSAEVYRCDGPAGKTYSDSPCPADGQVLEPDHKRGNALKVRPPPAPSKPRASGEKVTTDAVQLRRAKSRVNTASCDAWSCTGTDGLVYKRTADGFMRPDGVPCQRVEGQMQCN